MAKTFPKVVNDEEHVARIIFSPSYIYNGHVAPTAHPNHAGIVADIDKERVTALTPVSPEVMMIQKELANLCGEIIKFKQ